MKYFAKPASGLKADINRHREAEQRLLKKIEECDDDDFGQICAQAYRCCLYTLLQSKAELLSKIGRKL